MNHIILTMWPKKDKPILTGFVDEMNSLAHVMSNKTIARKNLENSILRSAKLSSVKKKSAVEDLKKCLISQVTSLSKKFLKEFNSAHQTPEFESN